MTPVMGHWQVWLVGALYWPARALLLWSIRKAYQCARNIPWALYLLGCRLYVVLAVMYPTSSAAVAMRRHFLHRRAAPVWHPLLPISLPKRQAR